MPNEILDVVFFWHFAEWTKISIKNATERVFFAARTHWEVCVVNQGTVVISPHVWSSYRPRIVRGFSRPSLFNGVDLLCHSLMYCDWPLIWMICMRPPCRRSTFLHLHNFFPNPLLWSNPLHRIWLNNCLHLNVAGTDMRYKLVCWHHDVLVARSRPAFWRPAFASRHSGYSLVN